MPGYLAIVLHAHLPFVRHPHQERSLEEAWLFEAVAECYLPLLEIMGGWARDGLPARLTLSISPTLLSMLQDDLLRERCQRHLDGMVELAEKEILRNHWDEGRRRTAAHYHGQFLRLRDRYEACGGKLVNAFGRLQEAGCLELATCAATHAVLPLLEGQPGSLRAQILTGLEQHRRCFGRVPAGFWLPECAYAPGLDGLLREAGAAWFILDTHGLMHARPQPCHGWLAPVRTPGGLAAFGRDPGCARQVWSRHSGYPGDPRYRDFYRDIGFDLEMDYVRPYLPGGDSRSFTGLKYHRITGPGPQKDLYHPERARDAIEEHAAHFVQSRLAALGAAAGLMDTPPILVAPYDAELFGHWWHEGPAFLDRVIRLCLSRGGPRLVTPTDYLRLHPALCAAAPSPSTWGEGGHLQVWLNRRNAWLQPPLRAAEARMTALVRSRGDTNGITRRALAQAARELLLAQSSDWPFIITAGTSPKYAQQRFTTHLQHFVDLDARITSGRLDEAALRALEQEDNVFPDLAPEHWQ